MSITCAHPFYRDRQLQSAAVARLLARKSEALITPQGRTHIKEAIRHGPEAFAGSRACSLLRIDQWLADQKRRCDTLQHVENVLLNAEYGTGCLGTVLEEIQYLLPEIASEIAAIADDSGLACDDVLPEWFATLTHARVQQWVNATSIEDTNISESWLEAILPLQFYGDENDDHTLTLQQIDQIEPDLGFVTQPVMPPGIENLRATPRRPGAPSGPHPH